MSDKQETFIHRENPPSLAMGFRVGIDEDICIIDFIDNPDKDVLKAFSAIILTKNGAKDLIKQLSHFIDTE